MIFNKKYLIGEELVRRKIITQDQLDEGIIYHEEKGIRLGRALIELGYIKEDELIKVLADQLGIMHVDFKALEITPELLGHISSEVAKRFNAFPVKYEKNILTICVSDPLNVNMMYELQKSLNKNILPSIASASAIKEAVNKYYK